MPEPIRLIALTGRAGAGKDSAADVLVRHRGYRRIAFADALRLEVAEAWRIDTAMLQDPTTKEWDVPALALGMCGQPEFVKWRVHAFDDDLSEPRSARWVMQRWGDWQRRANIDHYAEIVLRCLRRQVGTGWTRLVVTDLRFTNELAHLRAHTGGLRLVRVWRNRSPHHTRYFTHPSESELLELPTDADLVNGAGLAELERDVLKMEERLYA